jgi:DNA-binding response OmpR family regulator
MAILSIDDDPDLQDMVQISLKRYGYEIQRALTGEEGVEKVRALKPDLVLLDMMLPTINGLEVLRQLKSDAATRAVPVIVVTAFFGEGSFTKEAIIGAGAVEVLQKPVRFDELNALIVKVLTGGVTGA